VLGCLGCSGRSLDALYIANGCQKETLSLTCFKNVNFTPRSNTATIHPSNINLVSLSTLQADNIAGLLGGVAGHPMTSAALGNSRVGHRALRGFPRNGHGVWVTGWLDGHVSGWTWCWRSKRTCESVISTFYMKYRIKMELAIQLISVIWHIFEWNRFNKNYLVTFYFKMSLLHLSIE